MSGTEAGQFLEKGGSITTDKVDTYHFIVGLLAVFGVGCAFFLGSQIRRRLDQTKGATQ